MKPQSYKTNMTKQNKEHTSTAFNNSKKSSGETVTQSKKSDRSLTRAVKLFLNRIGA